MPELASIFTTTMQYFSFFKKIITAALTIVMMTLVLVNFVPSLNVYSATATTTTTTTSTNASNPVGFTDCLLTSGTGTRGNTSELFGKCLRQIRTFLVVLGLFLVAIRIALAGLEDFNPFVNGNSINDSIQLFRDIAIGLILILIPSVFLSFFNEASLNLNFIDLGGLISTTSTTGTNTGTGTGTTTGGTTTTGTGTSTSNTINLSNGTSVNLGTQASIDQLRTNPTSIAALKDITSKCLGTNQTEQSLVGCQALVSFTNTKPASITQDSYDPLLTELVSASVPSNTINKELNWLFVNYTLVSSRQENNTRYVQIQAQADSKFTFLKGTTITATLISDSNNPTACDSSSLLGAGTIPYGRIQAPAGCTITRVSPA